MRVLARSMQCAYPIRQAFVCVVTECTSLHAMTQLRMFTALQSMQFETCSVINLKAINHTPCFRIGDRRAGYLPSMACSAGPCKLCTNRGPFRIGLDVPRRSGALGVGRQAGA